MIQTVQRLVPAVVRADLAEAQESLAATLPSEVARKDSCAHVTADVLFHWCAPDGGPQRIRRCDDDEASLSEGAPCCSLSARLPYLS